MIFHDADSESRGEKTGGAGIEGNHIDYRRAVRHHLGEGLVLSSSLPVPSCSGPPFRGSASLRVGSGEGSGYCSLRSLALMASGGKLLWELTTGY